MLTGATEKVSSGLPPVYGPNRMVVTASFEHAPIACIEDRRREGRGYRWGQVWPQWMKGSECAVEPSGCRRHSVTPGYPLARGAIWERIRLNSGISKGPENRQRSHTKMPESR